MDPEQFRTAHLIGLHVCDRHVEDDWLADWVRSNATSTECDYCSRSGENPFAADADDLAEVVLDGLQTAYGNADDEGVPVEGGYVLATPMSSLDLLDEEGPFNDADLISAIADAMPHDAWVRRDFIRLSPFEQLHSSWEDFVELIKHHSRYFFGFREADVDDPDDLAPAGLLERIGRALEESGAVRTFREGSVFYRAVRHKAHESPNRAGRLGTAPVEFATEANRMSAAGIPMFYGSLDADTARIESASADPSDSPAFTVGAWRTLRPLRIVDVAQPIHVPSLFDPIAGHRRGEMAFLRMFVREISKTVERDRTEHIEYVPTQVVTEYLRSVFRPEDGTAIDGIIFPSAQKKGEAHINVALFVLNEHCVNADGTYDDGPDDEIIGVFTRAEMRPDPVLRLIGVERSGPLESAPSESEPDASRAVEDAAPPTSLSS